MLAAVCGHATDFQHVQEALTLPHRTDVYDATYWCVYSLVLS